MNLLILGASGYFGTEFVRQAIDRGHAVETIITSAPIVRVPNEIVRLCPNAVINCSAYTGRPTTAECETNRLTTWAANVTLPFQIGEAIRGTSIRFLHLSTGCRYRYRPEPYTIHDPPNLPIPRFYTLTKLLSDQYVCTLPNAIVARVRLPFHHVPHPRNLLTKLLAYPKVLDTRPNSLSHLSDAVQACLVLLESGASGPHNIVNPGYITNAGLLDRLRKAGHNPPGTLIPYLPDEPTISECVLEPTVPMRSLSAALDEAIARYTRSG